MPNQMNNLPLVSIVMPVYNEERFIAETVDYIQQQTYSNWELLVVDDQSTDKTQQILSSLAEQDNRIKFIVRNRTPKGAQTCRNTGIEMSSGKYIMVIDSDDIIRSHALMQRVSFMEANPELDFAIFKGVNFDERTQRINDGRKWGFNPHCDVLSTFLMAEYSFSMWNCIFKANIVKNNLFDETIMIYQDFDFLVRILLQQPVYSFDENSEIDYLYRQGHSGTITSNFISDGKYESTKRLFKKTMDEISVLSDFENKKNDYFGFFRLQLEKVALSGTSDQLKDFQIFIRSYYGLPHSIKLAIANILFRGPFISSSKYRRKYVHLVMALLYRPTLLLRYLPGMGNGRVRQKAKA